MTLRKTLLLVLFVASQIYAQRPPAIELGFAPERVYSFSGIDNINAFNGNNVITLPLTLQYQVSNHLTYQLAVVYNSKAWDYRYYVDEFAAGGYLLWAKSNIRSNAGMGWRVSMGRLLPPDSYTNTGDYKDNVHKWLYEGPTGDEHSFSSTVYSTPPFSENENASVQFTVDGSFLRMVVVNSTTRKVEFPDGPVHTFTLDRGIWQLTKIEDQFQNNVTITYFYQTQSPTDSRVSFYTIADSTGREHTVRFRYISELADAFDRGMNLEFLDMEGVNGQTVRYTFGIEVKQINYDCHHSYIQSQQHPSAPAGNLTWVPLLTSITLPDDTTYEFSYYEAANASCSQGMLQNLTLPTKGVISYTYQQYILPPPKKCDLSGPGESSVGIKTRTADGSTWTYLQTYGPAEQTTPPTSDPQFACGPPDESGTIIEPDPPIRWARTSILTPTDADGARSRTDHYFNVHSGAGGADRLDIPGFPKAFGDPFAIGLPPPASAGLAFPPNDGSVLDETGADTPNAPATTRAISQQVWKDCTAVGDCTLRLRSTHRRNADVFADAKAYREIKSERTTFHDDLGCVAGGQPVACYVQTDRTDFDRIGHWRTTTTSSNYPGATNDERRTNYVVNNDAQLNNPATKWVWTRFTDTTRNSTGKTTFCFADTGLLLRKRVLAGASEGSSDLLTQYTYAASTGSAARAGDLTDEQAFGGDLQSVSTISDLCGMTLGTPEYWTLYTYANGVLATIEPRTSTGQPLCPSAHCLRTTNYTSDTSGLITTSKATDTLATTYAYKDWGTLESVTPPGETPTTYTYTPATASTFAQVTALRNPDPSISTDDVTTTYEYDRLGRVQRTTRFLPGAGCAEQVLTYDQQGRKVTDSVWKACGATAGATTYRYDALGRTTRIKNPLPDAKETTIAYAGARVVTRTREIGTAQVATREEYDSLGRMISITENADTNPSDGITGELTTTYTYDVGDRLNTVTTGAQTRTFSYDHRGYLFSEQHPELGANGNGTAAHLYDSRGHVRQKSTGAIGITMTYDSAERLLTVRELSTNNLLKEFVYDNYGACVPPLCLGKLAAAARYHYDTDLGNPPVSESYQYSPATGGLGRRDTAVGLSPPYAFWQDRGFNTLGMVAVMNYSCPTGWTCRRIGQGDGNGVLTSITYLDPQGQFTYPPYATITYQSNGMIDTVTHGVGSSTIRETWTPDASGIARPARITATNNAGTPVWTTGDYTYDGSGNITGIGSDTYRNDAFDRLETWQVTRADGWTEGIQQTYDPYGNLLGYKGRTCRPNGQSCTFTSFTPYQIVGTTNHYVGMTYDAAGNVLNDFFRQFTYDALGVLTRTTTQGRDFRFLYAPDDERIVAVERIAGTNKTTYTLRNLNNQLVSVWTVNPSTGAISWKEDALWRGGTLLAREQTSGTTHYSLDHLGSPRSLTGAQVGTQAFAPFGAGGTSNGGALQFTGHERDAANLADGTTTIPDYFHARYYDMNWGRFLSSDPARQYEPLTNSQGWNRYVYAQNNPLKFTDPDGQRPTIFQRAAAATITAGSAVQAFGASLNNGGVVGLIADATLGTAGSIVQGYGDMLNLGTSAGEIIDTGGDAYDVGMAFSAELGRASAIIGTAAGGAQVGGVSSTVLRGTTVATADGAVAIPSGMVRSIAANRQGVVYSPAGQSGNAGIIRVAGPNASNSGGYVRVYNQHGQPIVVSTGKPGPNAATHPALTGPATVRPVRAVPIPCREQQTSGPCGTR